jgi:hypothetical protein
MYVYYIQSNPAIAPPSLVDHRSLGTEIPYRTVFRLTATFAIQPQSAANYSLHCDSTKIYVRNEEYTITTKHNFIQHSYSYVFRHLVVSVRLVL